MVSTFKGSLCVDPPTPDSKHNLALSWNKNFPPTHDETIMYKCNAGQTYNRFESDFDKQNLTLKCLPDNKFEEVDWPTCLDGKIHTVTVLYNNFFQ